MELKTKDIELSTEEYEQILDECYSKVSGESDDDWQDIIDRHNLSISRDHLRKNCTGIFGSAFVKKHYENKYANENFTEDDYEAKINEKIRELEVEKVKFRDERAAWSKQNREFARIETTLSMLEEELKKIGNVNFEVHDKPIVDGNNELAVILSDMHIGQTFSSYFGEYNSDIAKQRLNMYLNEVIRVGMRHGAKNVNVVNLADVISGSIHKTIAITNKENLIEQIKLATELISSFCYELTKHFENVKYYGVVGNHERCDKKEDALHDERYGDLVNWGVEITLSHIPNFHYLKHRNLDSGIVDINILGKTYIGCHGDFDPTTKNGVANLSFMLGFIPYAILKGHLHFPAMNEINGVKVVQSGSLVGCGDSFTVEHRLTGSPSQTILVCNKFGIECIYNVDLGVKTATEYQTN